MEREVTITRTFKAPLDLVWKAWTEPERLMQWWSPRRFSNPVCEVDPHVGGKIYIVMRGPDGTEHAMRGVFKKVVPQQQLVFTNFPVDQNDQPMLDGITTVTFSGQGDTTTITVNARAVGLVPIAAMMLRGMEQGWTETIDKLGEYLTSG